MENDPSHYTNAVRLRGYLMKPPEVRGETLAILTLGTKRLWPPNDPAPQWRTDTHRVTAWDRLARVAAMMKEGDHLEVEAELRNCEEYRPVRVALFISRLIAINAVEVRAIDIRRI
jgi:hypothetical protein